jgi:hypothetical protein
MWRSDSDYSAFFLPESLHSSSGCHPSLRSAPLSLVPQKKSVTFSSSARCRRVLHIKKYTEQEIEATWYTQEEIFQARENDAQRLTRGLEYSNAEGAQTRIFNKLLGRYSVLDAQDKQWKEGIQDPVGLANIYMTATEHCQEEAYKLGCAFGKDLHDRYWTLPRGSVQTRLPRSSSDMSMRLLLHQQKRRALRTKPRPRSVGQHADPSISKQNSTFFSQGKSPRITKYKPTIS